MLPGLPASFPLSTQNPKCSMFGCFALFLCCWDHDSSGFFVILSSGQIFNLKKSHDYFFRQLILIEWCCQSCANRDQDIIKMSIEIETIVFFLLLTATFQILLLCQIFQSIFKIKKLSSWGFNKNSLGIRAFHQQSVEQQQLVSFLLLLVLAESWLSLIKSPHFLYSSRDKIE